MKNKVCFDVYDIAKRIKYIDDGYYLMFDTDKQVFEVHNSSQIGSSYCLTLPYKELDERCLRYVLKTQSVNIDEIVEKLEIENRLRESAITTSTFSTALDGFKNLEN